MMLIGYLHGITSERRLCQEVHLNLAYRWFCGLTSPSLTDKGLSSVEMLKRSQFRFELNPKDVSADSAYARGEVLTVFMETGVNVYTPKPTDVPCSRTLKYGKDHFKYDESNNQLICPQGHRLRKVEDKSKPRLAKYVASEKHCRSCPVKEQCTQGKKRTVRLHIDIDQEALDWAETLRNSKEYKIRHIMSQRIERLFGEAKEYMGVETSSSAWIGGSARTMLDDCNGPKHQTHRQVIQSKSSVSRKIAFIQQ